MLESPRTQLPDHHRWLTGKAEVRRSYSSLLKRVVLDEPPSANGGIDRRVERLGDLVPYPHSLGGLHIDAVQPISENRPFRGDDLDESFDDLAGPSVA